MGILVHLGTMMTCSFGSAPSTLMVTPENKVLGPGPAATIFDMTTGKNILPFGTCSSPANPAVIAAFGAPVPCTPMPTPWVPGSVTVLIANKPALNNLCKCVCAYAGVIQIVNTPQTNTIVGN